MAPLFSKADLNKFWYDVQNEVILIYAKFGKDLFSISKVIGHKKVAPVFWPTLYVTKIPQRYRRTDGRLGAAIPRSA